MCPVYFFWFVGLMFVAKPVLAFHYPSNTKFYLTKP